MQLAQRWRAALKNNLDHGLATFRDEEVGRVRYSCRRTNKGTRTRCTWQVREAPDEGEEGAARIAPSAAHFPLDLAERERCKGTR